jgi:hypothetical protein
MKFYNKNFAYRECAINTAQPVTQKLKRLFKYKRDLRIGSYA